MDSDTGYLRIATEEAFAPPELVTMWQSMLADGTCDDPGFVSLQGFYMRSKAERPAAVLARLQDLGERRIADMDAAGVDRQIISLTCPGTQILDRDRAIAMATLANDQLAEACRRHPDRFSGLTAVAPQDPPGAAKEIERGAHELGLVGVIINSHTQGEYTDDPKFWPIFEAAEALDTPIYLHPNTPPRAMIGPLLESGLDSAIYGFAVETGMHLLRIITSGVFDRFPRLRMVVGHLGEALPFWLYRLDYMHAATVKAGRYESMKPIGRRPSDYLRSNVWVTTSGMPWAPAIMFCREVLGPDRVMYAMDYPYEYVPEEVTAQDQLPLDGAAKKAFFQGIAEEVFGLLSGWANHGPCPSGRDRALSSWSRFLGGGGLMTQQYSWPGPLPPWARRGSFKFIRCVQCKGSLYHTMGKGQPRQEDHEQGCEAYIKAMRIMRYVEELKRAAAQPHQGSWRSTRRRRKYLRTGAKEMSVAACQGDPGAAITALGDLYQAECQKRGKSAKVTELTELAETLMRACRQLARGQNPAPIVSGPG